MASSGESLSELNRVAATAGTSAAVVEVGGIAYLEDAYHTDAASYDISGLSDAVSQDESVIAPDVLPALLPDEDVVVLPKVKRIAGGAVYRFSKRSFDILMSACALIVLAIPMMVIAILVKATSRGPAIYSHRRVGLDGKEFMLHKFRSMNEDAEGKGACWTADGDDRITPLGKKLRMSRLDELPQFWNVIKGDMSLVGPRPERPVFCDAFRKKIEGWDQRTMVRPGITGLAQVRGGYDLLPKEKALFDIEYIETRSACLDLRLLFETVAVLFSHEGAR